MPGVKHENGDVILLNVVCAEGIDKRNDEHETHLDIRVYSNSSLAYIHSGICRTLELDETKTDYRYTKNDSSVTLSMDRTLRELSIEDGDIIHLETTKLKRNNSRGSTKAEEHTMYNDEEINMNEVLTLNIVTRILAPNGEPYRKVTVVVQASHCCSDMMEDISHLWGKSGLKFKIGSKVLYPDKSYKRLEVENGAVIVVTGGRD